MCDSELKMAMAMVSPSLKKILDYPNSVVCVLTFDDRETEKTRFFWFLGSKFHSNMASRAASYLRISVFHTGFASVLKDLEYLDQWVRVDGNSANVGIPTMLWII
ncbi:hypothetical protein SO802_029580 [Lithocarpus litseifolius]|uniref:Uncharacterized protein n=1 Tax=Lithocarpus litseifolius TaxID=425828 RepID=A0AAW2BTN3_9ROSI